MRNLKSIILTQLLCVVALLCVSGQDFYYGPSGKVFLNPIKGRVLVKFNKAFDKDSIEPSTIARLLNSEKQNFKSFIDAAL